MPPRVPLRVTVRIDLLSGAAAGQRRHRLCSEVGLPAELWLPGVLSFDAVDADADPARRADGEGEGTVSFVLPPSALDEGGSPRGQRISAAARLSVDVPADGPAQTRITLRSLADDERAALEAYVSERMNS